VLYDNYGEIMPLVASTYFRTKDRREINGLINAFRVDIMKFEKVFGICSVFAFWLLIASAYDLVLGWVWESEFLTDCIFDANFV